MSEPLLSVQDLSVAFRQEGREIRAVDSVSFDVAPRECVALVGESGSGKSVTALSVLKLLPYPAASHPSGRVLFKGQDLLAMPPDEIRKVRGDDITMVFQEPMTSLNPVHTIERQIAEVLSIHEGISGRQARNREPVAEASSPVAAPRASQPEPSRIRPAARLELGPARKVSLLAPLYLAVPVAIWSHLTAFDVRLTMAMALLGLIPLGALTCTAIRQLTVRSSPGAAHLIIALAGNGAALALIIASALSGQPLLALMITAGSIAANLLLVLGLALMARGTGAGPLRFEPQGSGRGAAAIALAVTALGFPTLQRLISSDAATLPLPQLAQATGGLLLAAFLASIIFVVHGRRHFLGDPDHDAGQLHGAWSVPQATLALLAGLIGMAAMAIIAVYEVPAFSAVMQLSPTFMGMILIPAVASLAQHSGEITAARRGHPELAISSTLSATTALALLAAPVLVGVALITGVASADLVFAPLALIAMAVAAIGAGMITREGEARWFEGFLLLVLYGLLVAGSWLF